MNNECNIVLDILPLYIENIVSDDTKEFVEKHITQCSKCKKELEMLKTDIPFKNEYTPTDNPANAMKKIGLNIYKKRVFTSVISAIFTAVIVVICIAFLTAPEYLPYFETIDTNTINENNGTVTLSFNGEYTLSTSEDGVYSLSVYTTLWNDILNINPKQFVTVNPDGENVNTIYYVTNNGVLDKIIYGESQTNVDTVITLPRLFLNSYLVIAITISILIFVLLLAFRKKVKIKTIIINLLLAPISYIISTIIITGINSTSYSATRDFYFILLLSILLYSSFYFLHRKIFLNNRKHKM